MVRLEFSIALRYQISGPSDFIFNLHAAETGAQRIVSERVESNVPVVPVICTDPHYGNRLMRMKAADGELDIRYEATVDIEHFVADRESLDEVPVDHLPSDVLSYLLPSRYCQSDQMTSISCWEFGHLPKGYTRVEAIARWVRQRTRFEPGTSTSGTTALDTLTDQRGVCRDYAHLMIALCRSLNIPARFVTGIDYGADPALGPPDFHAYVEAYLGNRWYLFDPTGISPTTGLLRIGTGRDAADASFATLFGSVRCGMPVVSIRSIVDPAQGIAAPEPTDMAVSTADPVAQSPMLHLVRPYEGTLPPQATRPPAYGRHYA
jgi:transglutaminase-like putative cysteine protease